MDAIQLLCSIIHLRGENAFMLPFSARWVNDELKYSLYTSRKLIKSLKEYGLVKRLGNQYIFTLAGYNIARDVMRASKNVKK